jgi:hypothetical protein
MDNLRAYEGVNTFDADKVVATKHTGDMTRIKTTKFIKLESQFYYAFRNRIRILINQFANSKLKNEIRQIADNKTILYSQKIERIEPLIHTLIRGYVDFADIDEPTLMDLADANCDNVENENPACIINDGVQIIIPHRNLISNHNNKKIYIGRIADELIRNERVKSIMYDMENRLNAKTIDYQIRDDEFILVQSALTTEYFSELEAYKESTPYAVNTNYELASPSISVVYPNEKIPLSEQYKPAAIADAAEGEENAAECLVRISKIIGNKKQVWDRIFSEDAREHIFRNTANCTFQPLINIVESKLGEKWTESDMKRRLSAAYLKLFERDPTNLSKVTRILREQGKSRMFEKINTPELFQNAVINNGYFITDIDIWVIANEYNLPIVVFNANGLKGFFAKVSDVENADTNTHWIKMGGDKGDNYHFIRSKIRVAKGSYANYIPEYNLIVPAVKLSQTKEFGDMVVQSYNLNMLNTCKLEEALERFL